MRNLLARSVSPGVALRRPLKRQAFPLKARKQQPVGLLKTTPSAAAVQA